jgi:hypothetical protein
MSLPQIGNTPPSPEDREHLLEMYLDGMLKGDQLVSFQRMLADDPSLRAEVDLQHRINASLKREFAYEPPAHKITLPSNDAPALRLDRTSEAASLHAGQPATKRHAPNRRLQWLLAAAAMLALVVGVQRVFFPSGQPAFETPDRTHARLVNLGFQPEFVCTTDPEFQATVREQFGEALSLAPLAPGAGADPIQLVGWAYGDNYTSRILGERTLVLMARVSGEPVIVLIDHLSNDRVLRLDDASRLSLNRARIGQLVVYEVSPLPEPALLPRLINPDNPSDKQGRIRRRDD